MILSDISNLSKTSKEKIEVVCTICNNISSITYYSYNRNIERGGFFSCKSCSSIKRKKTMMRKYGVENSMFSIEVKDKIKKTNLERYGVENVFQSKDIKDKIKETNLERYGHECSLNSEVIKGKIKKTNLERYGHEHHMKSPDIKDKLRFKNLEKYGVDSYFKSEEYHLNTNIGNDVNYIRYISNSNSLFKCEEGHEFEINIDNYIGRKKKNIPLCTICNPINSSKSIKEKEILEFINSNYDGEIVHSYRDGLEIDIYLPELNIGFEFNGLYWHSDLFKEKNYHLNKTNYFKERGVRIIHIWEDDWVYRKDIIKSQIRNWLGLTENKIFARNCEVSEVKEPRVSSNFLEENHIQGKVGSSLKLGLYYLGDLVSLMTFDHLEGRNKMNSNEWNINRFCNKINTNVIGGASKLFKYFIKNYDVSRVISYSDKDWSQGQLYECLGFGRISDSNPDYKYVVNNHRVHKSRFKKDNLNIGDKTKFTESEFMIERGIFRVYDCGKIKFEKLYETYK